MTFISVISVCKTLTTTVDTDKAFKCVVLHFQELMDRFKI